MEHYHFFCSLVFILDLNFKNLKYTRRGWGLTFASAADKCLRVFIMQQSAKVVLMPR